MKTKRIALYAFAALVAGLIISPFIGMAIGSTRELILGLAPDEAVLQLADKIDADRAGVDQKTDELQSLIDTQSSQIAEQQGIIDQQKADLDKQAGEVSQTKSDVAANNAKLSNEEKCRKANELFVDIPQKPKDGCYTTGPNNIVDMYKEIKSSYSRYKDDNKTDAKAGLLARDCFKNSLKVLEPAYNEYLKAKELCK